MKDGLEKQIREIEQSISREEQKGPVEKLPDLDGRHLAVSRIRSQISRTTKTLVKHWRRYFAEYEQNRNESNERLRLLSKLPSDREIITSINKFINQECFHWKTNIGN
jgi:hypothetical protein